MASSGRAPPGTRASDPVTVLKGVGERLAARLGKLGILRVQDLLFHLPVRYQDRSRRAPIGSLRPGDEVAITGTVGLAQTRFGRRPALLVHLEDGTGSILLRFFHFGPRQQERFTRGTRISCYGEVRSGPAGLEMVHPELGMTGDEPGSDGGAVLTPVYPATAGLHQATLRGVTARALELMESGEDFLAELVPARVRERCGLMTLRDALCLLHRPPADSGTDLLLDPRHPARRTIAFEELLAHQVSMRRLRARARALRAPALRPAGDLKRRLLESLPFELTGAQRRVIAEIERDLARETPMQRLVQGDVGSGKTAVAAAAVLVAVEAGRQAAVMAPTELLAEQHHRTLGAWLRPLGIEPAWIAGKTRGAGRAQALEDVRSGTAAVVIGTHALFQDEVEFAALGLVVIDEQHRFGVHQRLALREKGRQGARYPHQLIMTATPIPRTLTMTAYADLDCSVIDELPPGREPVSTVVVPDTRRDEVLARVRSVCREGRQAYWVCPLIGESEALQCQAASETAVHLAEALPDLRVGLVHGRLRPAEKEEAMGAFKSGAVDVLVATTVIEVGVDVPNASLMIVENAERLGLAQLHQLRGRVGRGGGKSVCVLMYHSPLSEKGRARLGILRESADGFEIARRDLELRGPGEILGVRQAGELRLRTADLLRDADLVPMAADAADRLLADDSARADALVRRWMEDAPRYGAV